jgi:hypothetical protein
VSHVTEGHTFRVSSFRLLLEQDVCGRAYQGSPRCAVASLWSAPAASEQLVKHGNDAVIIACQQTTDLDEAGGVTSEQRRHLCARQGAAARELTREQVAEAEARARKWLREFHARKP